MLDTFSEPCSADSRLAVPWRSVQGAKLYDSSLVPETMFIVALFTSRLSPPSAFFDHVFFMLLSCFVWIALTNISCEMHFHLPSAVLCRTVI